MSKSKRFLKKGFTLIELVMVILLLAILAAIAIPNFLDFRSDAKNGAVLGALGAFRSAIGIATAAIALREDPTLGALPKYPSVAEFQGNQFLAASPNSHPVLASASVNIMDPAQGFPKNPWTLSTLQTVMFNSIFDCSAIAASAKVAGLTAPNDNRGWCYTGSAGISTGIFWANSKRNGATSTEVTY